LQGDELKVVACEGFDNADKKKVMRLSFPLTEKFPNSKVIKSKRPYVVSDIHASGYKHFWDEANVFCSGNIRSWLGVPLLFGHTVIGMLSIDSAKSHSYTNAHRELVLAFSRQIAAALVNAKLHKTTESLLNIILDLTEQLELDTVLRKLVTDAVDKEGIIGADIAVIYLYDPDHNRIDEHPVFAGLPFHRRKSLDLNNETKSLVHEAIRAKEPWITKDVRTDRLLYRSFARENKVSSVGVFPLRVGDESVGVIFVNYLTPHSFDKTEKELMTMIARKAALLIQHTRKYKVISERFAFAKKAAVSLYALSAWAHDARSINYDIGGKLSLLKSSLRNVSQNLTRISKI